MNRFIILMIWCSVCVPNGSQAQVPEKGGNKKLLQITTQDVRSGKYLDRAKLFSPEKFVEYYVQNGKEIETKKWGL